jgi:CHAT domain-containing protein
VASVQGRRLYEALFAKLEGWTGENGTFAVEADDFLGVLPFEALVDGQGRALGERFAFVERESDEERRRLAAGDVPLTTQDATLVIADPALRGAMRISHPALSSAEREGEFVASLFPRTILLAREDATRRNLEKNRPVARLFHFAGHASLTGAGAAVLLAPGEEGEADVLNASAVQARDWTHCELVVLAACSTGLGEDSFSGPPALAQAFLDAGARRVLASRWAVDSETTAAFMKRFYVALAGGESAAQAVRTAATLTRNVSPHPFYWAAFALHGLE